MSLRKGGYVIAGTPNITTGHHVGEIFYTSRLDNELNGAVEANGGVYAVAAFTGERSVPALLAEGKLPYVSMSEYESIVSANGSCRAFGWDGADATVFKVPKLNDVYLMAGTAASAGEFISESLPNIAGTFGSGMTQGNFFNFGTGAFGSYKDPAASQAVPEVGGPFDSNNRWDFNASRSSSTYQDGAKVRPDSVRYRAMVQLATGVKEDATQLKEYQFNNPNFFGQSMWTDVEPNNASWLASNGQWNAKSVYPDYYDWLVGQMNAGVSGFVASTATYTDYDFVVNTADQTFRLPLLDGSEDLPGEKVIEFDLKASGGTYDIPFNGRFTAVLNMSSEYSHIAITVNGKRLNTLYASGEIGLGDTFDVKKGDVVTVLYGQASGTPTKHTLQLTCSKGNGSLYYYVGDTVQDASLINAGAILGQLANKVDTTLASVDNTGNVAATNLNSKGIRTVIETYRNGTEWYRVWSDGWCEQGGGLIKTGTITFLKPFIDTNITLLLTRNSPYTGGITAGYHGSWTSIPTQIGFTCFYDANTSYSWYACGYIR